MDINDACGDHTLRISVLRNRNIFVVGFQELIAEAHVFAEKTGLGSSALEALVEQQYGPLALSMSRRLTTGAYVPARGARRSSQ